MKQKTLFILAATAALTAAVAAVSLSHRDAAVTAGTTAEDTSQSEKDLLFPGLLDRINDVQTVTVVRKDGEATLRKNADRWGLADKDGFPIEMEPMRKMLIAIGQMKKVEPKTSDPSRYEQIGVQDPSAEGSKSALITLKDASGKEMAQLVLGKEHESKGAALSNQRYVRKPGDAQAWLVQGTFDLKEKGSDWLEKKVLEVKRDRIRSVEITQPEGELLIVDRPDEKTKDYTLLEIPEGKELSYPAAAGGIAGGLEYVNLDDVEPIEKIDFTSGAGPVAKFKTFDGLVITATMKDQDGKTWAKFAASYEAPPPEPAAPAADPAAPDAKPEEPKDAAAPAKKSPEEVQKEAAELQARLSKWAYQISSYTRANLGKKKSELLKDKAPPPADPNAPIDPNAPDKGAVMLPDDLPPEIREQIKAHQESIGNKVAPAGVSPGATKQTEPAPKDPPKPVEPPH